MFLPNALKFPRYLLTEPDDCARMHQNEGIAWPESTVSRAVGVVSQALNLNVYPQLVPTALTRSLAALYEVDSDCVEVTCGSSEALLLIAMACYAPGKNIACVDPAFSLYQNHIRLFGAKVTEIPLDNRFEYTRDSLFNRSVLTSDVIVLCSPNNPTGTCVPTPWIQELVTKTSALIVLDEAYIEFSETTSMATFATKNKNLIVLRTLSKAWGLAALRVGCMIGMPETLGVFKALRAPYSINTPALLIANDIVTNDQILFRERIAAVRKTREQWQDALGTIQQVTVFNSDANFVFFRARNADALAKYLLAEFKLNIRVYHSDQLDQCLRVSVSDNASNLEFLRAVKQFYEKEN